VIAQTTITSTATIILCALNVVMPISSSLRLLFQRYQSCDGYCSGTEAPSLMAEAAFIWADLAARIDDTKPEDASEAFHYRRGRCRQLAGGPTHQVRDNRSYLPNRPDERRWGGRRRNNQPDGQITQNPVQPLPQKYSDFPKTRITLYPPRPAPHEGRSRSSRTWGGMRWTRMAPLTNGAGCGRRSRVVLTPRRWR
jgi:hypothetical protein